MVIFSILYSNSNKKKKIHYSFILLFSLYLFHISFKPNLKRALALLLRLDEMYDVKLIVSSAHNTANRTQIIAKYLELVGRSDIPIAIGIQQDDWIGPLYGWASDYNLSNYAGQIYTDGIAAFANAIISSPIPVQILAIAPTQNFASLVQRFPQVVSNIEMITAMSGSINRCYGDVVGHCPEYNVYESIVSSQIFYSTQWPISTTPLDTSQLVLFSGELYRQLVNFGNNSNNLIVQTLLDCYCFWSTHGGGWNTTWDCANETSILYDPTAFWMTFIAPNYAQSNLGMVTLPLIVDNLGNTIVDHQRGQNVSVAIEWLNDGLDEFEHWIVKTLLTQN